eukprot:CAMPEP_0177683352 /NCGR_PEP_ID=MMETSP0447-20121125/31759_1 /TAXON_ID=0 /ORGANISM="Stygamoeba regulata, Strain BSH-02190019" /LENGTH=181 /DNA_ID=CAMNT_0019192941 /DNA_START=216 /DNA_END=758 /DNA_ORIENTATION=+
MAHASGLSALSATCGGRKSVQNVFCINNTASGSFLLPRMYLTGGGALEPLRCRMSSPWMDDREEDRVARLRSRSSGVFVSCAPPDRQESPRMSTLFCRVCRLGGLVLRGGDSTRGVGAAEDAGMLSNVITLAENPTSLLTEAGVGGSSSGGSAGTSASSLFFGREIASQLAAFHTSAASAH